MTQQIIIQMIKLIVKDNINVINIQNFSDLILLTKSKCF